MPPTLIALLASFGMVATLLPASASAAPVTFRYTIDPAPVSQQTGLGIGTVTGGLASITFPIPGSATTCSGGACGSVTYRLTLYGTGGTVTRTNQARFAVFFHAPVNVL